ncbi:MAG: homoserine kinase [Actinomycetota bacterium]
MIEIYPSARGMGASASAIVAGLVGARAFGDLELDDPELARLAVRMEGHGDNVLPAMFGGLVLNSQDGWLHFDPTDQILPMILVAAQKFKTSSARAVLPADVPRVDAVANISATAALLSALIGSAPIDSLMASTADRLHEPYRLPLMPQSLGLHEGLRGKGIPTALAGAGPSLISLVPADRIEDAKRTAEGLIPGGWEIMTPGWDLQGAKVR